MRRLYVLAAAMVGMLGFAAPWRADAGGTWTALAHAPPVGLDNALMLSDGTVMCGNGGSAWYRLTPDIHGSYVNGTWTALASTRYTRLFFSSDVLTNGNVYVAGGEYGTGKDHAELYDSLNDSWSEIPRPTSDPSYSDAVSKILPGGKVLQGTTGGGVWIYNPVANNITAGPSARNQNEACWVKLPSDNILTIDAFGQQSEHYVPSLNAWSNDGNVPVAMYGYGGELGAGFLLPNGNVFYIGGTNDTAIYTPGSTVTSAGTWVAGPNIPNNLGAVDAPSAMMVNGKILCALGADTNFGNETFFYEYDYTSNAFTQVNGPTGGILGGAPFGESMLDLADGNVLLISGQGSTKLYIYTPDGSPLVQGQPAINSVTQNADGSYHLAGTGLNGISTGAAYGDDWQMDSNYPLVRMTNNTTGNVYYARAYGWNSTSVMTGSRMVTTEFSLPANLPAGTYSLVVVANGNPSLPVTFSNAPPPAPISLNATIGNAQLGLTWSASSGAASYNVRRSTNNGGPYYAIIANVSGTSYTDTGLANGTTYYYVVTAIGSGGPSAYSAQLAVAPFGPPAAPRGVIAAPTSFLGINVSWNSVSGASSYNVKRSLTNDGPYTVIANHANPDCEDTNVVSGTTYYYVVSAISAGGESANSIQVAAMAFDGGDVLNGLVGNWRFDEGSGSSAADSSGNNNNGLLFGGPTWVTPGRIGAAALSFNPTNAQYVSVPNTSTLNMTTGITLAAWIYANDWSGNRRIVQKGNSDNQYRLLAENNVFKFNPNGVGTLAVPLPPSNVWIHVAGTWDGSTMIIYTNGVAESTFAAGGTITSTSDPIAIGTKNGGTIEGNCFSGELDEVRIYNRALSVAELNTVMHAGDDPPTTPTGLTALVANTSVNLSWAVAPGAASYNVKRSTVSGGPYAVVGVSFDATYTDAGLTNGTTYYYVVSAVNATNETANSLQASATPVVGVTFYVDINYGGAAAAALGPGNYTLFQLQAAGIANDSASSCTIPGGWTVIVYQNDNYGGTAWTLSSNTPNFTLFSGLNDAMSSCKILSGGLTPVPTGLSAMAANAQVNLSWNAVSGATYNLKRSTNNGGPYSFLASTTVANYTDTGLSNGTNYYYVVSATTVRGESANSAQVVATPALPLIVLSVVSQTAGQFSLQFSGTDGQSYIVEMSPDLTTWTPVYTNTQSGGVFIYTDTNPSDPARYYRVKQ